MESQLLGLLRRLIETAGVTGNEDLIAGVIRDELVDCGIRSESIEEDRMGNLWIQLGPQVEPQRLLAAHMDEIGLRITSIRDDGICKVAAIGGIDPQLWEGTRVVVHTQRGHVQGCIAPVSHHVTFRTSLGPKGRIGIEELLLDVGAGSRQAVEGLGINLLDSVTWPKQLDSLAGGLVQGRSLDDRFGCCAQLVALRELDIAQVKVPTIIAWTVQEEVGLRGAKALAERFKSLREVIAVDSYTVGTGPRDNKQFDECRPGQGPVLRCWDSTTILPDRERRQVLSKAAGSGVAVQHGYMPGGNDASVFEPAGARVFGFSVPLQYSHSQVERIHMDDLAGLSKLLAWWCCSGLD